MLSAYAERVWIYLERVLDMVIVTLMRRKHAGFTLETQGVEHRAFPNMKAAKKWLKANNFIYGQRDFLKYDGPDDKEWCHVNDASWDFIKVIIETLEDPEEDSCYKNFDPGMAPWLKAAYEEGRREGFAGRLVKLDMPRDEKIKMFIETFGDSKADAEYWISYCEKESAAQ